eukprot:gene12046-14730_t
MVNEKYEDFVKNFQKEVEADTGIKFGVIEDYSFNNIVLSYNGDVPEHFGAEKSKELWNHLLQESYIGTDGKITDFLRTALLNNKVKLPVGLAEGVKEQVLK